MSNKYNHLNLIDWPFKLVPDREYCKIWAGRKQLKEDIRFFLESLSRRTMSSIRLMWAWVGSGKSHTLRHIEFLSESKFKNIIPLYIVFPKSAKSFFEVYKEIMQNINFDKYLCNYKENLKYLSTFLRIISQGAPIQKDIAYDWIKGEKIDLRTLKSIGINQRIEDSNTSTKVLSELIRVIVSENKDKMFLLMVDEIQKIGELNSKQRNDINTALHTLFNELPNNLTLLLSFSVRQQEVMYSLISPELKNRANLGNIFELTLFDEEEAKEFITQLIDKFKIDEKKELPFTKSAVDYIISFIEHDSEYELKPRDIIEKFNEVLEHGDIEVLNKKTKAIDENFAKSILEKNE